VAVLSLWALVSGHWAAWQAARVEVAQEAEQDRVVDKLVAETTLQRTSSNVHRAAG
jgi:hypothetical protein